MRCLPVISCLAAAVAVLALAPTPSQSMALPQCHPSVLQSGSDRIRKVCAALSTMYELSSAMENYLDDKGTLQSESEGEVLAIPTTKELTQLYTPRSKGIQCSDVEWTLFFCGR